MKKISLLVAILLSSIFFAQAKNETGDQTTVGYFKDSVDSKTGIRTVMTNLVAITGYSEKELKKARRGIIASAISGIEIGSGLEGQYHQFGMSFLADQKNYQLILSLYDPTKFSMDNYSTIKFNFSDNTSRVFQYEGLVAEAKEMKNHYSYTFTLDVDKKDIELFAQKEIASVDVVVKSNYKHCVYNFVTRHPENATKVQAYAQDFLGRTNDMKINQYTYFTKNIDEFTGMRQVETSFLPIRSGMMDMTISTVDTFYYINIYAPEVNDCVRPNGDFVSFKFEDQTINRFTLAIFKCPEKWNDQKMTFLKVACDRAFVEKLASKKLEMVRVELEQPIGFYVTERKLRERSADYVLAYAKDFIAQAPKLASEKRATDYLAKRVYPAFSYQGSFDQCEVEESAWQWRFMAKPEEVSPEMALQLKYDVKDGYKIDGWVNSSSTVNSYHCSIYFKFTDGTLKNLPFHTFHASKEIELNAYPYQCAFETPTDLNMFKMLSEKQIEKIRVQVEDQNNTNSFINIEATLSPASQLNLKNQASDIVKYSTMQRPNVGQ